MVSYIAMATEAVKALKERGGSSSQAIKKVPLALRAPALRPGPRSPTPAQRAA